MSDHRAESLVGGVVLAAAIGFVVYAAQITGFSRDGGSYPLTASFRSLEGVGVGTDVRLAGVKIGTVTDISLNPETYRADTVFTVREGVQIPDDSAILVASEGLLGGNYVEISPGGSLFYLEPGEEIIDTQSSVSLVTLLLKFFTEGDE
ncbi:MULTISPECIES: outer membrane lipid asymmetry maintenance protein MlaD [unclassified Rhodosalinus]|uniref:outer membrane lipid asymmetry maintenance protein MlaD n=1 Tax=unclassified Rhodosalinus TaxID=2630183 RepID=UPI003525FF37